MSADKVTVGWNAIVGRIYRLQFKDSLNDPDWTDLDSDITADSAVLSKADTMTAARRERYYRVLLIE